MLSRRSFLQCAAAGVGLFGCTTRSAPPRRLGDLGIILGWMRPAFEADYLGTLQQIAETGYRYVEFGGHFGPSREAFLSALRDLNLRPIAGGGNMERLKSDLPSVIEDCHETGKEYVVCYWPWTHSGNEIDGLDELMRISDDFNVIGSRCRENGLRFAFHNHDHEFRTVEDRIPYDVFLENTDPDLVTMQIDLYWIIKGGGDPHDYFDRYPGRFDLVHVKDMAPGPEQDFAAPGHGIIDFPSIFARADQAGFKYYIVEHDAAPDPLWTMREGYRYLSNLEL
jgi:sugar phosphate isomerase/epimerase